MKYFLVIVFIIISQYSFSQDIQPSGNKIFNITQVGYGKGIGKINLENNNGLRNEGYFVRLRTTFGFNVSPQLSLGLGFGLDGYHSPSYNTAPLILDAHYYFKESKNCFFVSYDAGYSLKLSDSFKKGQYHSFNVGYRIKKGKKIQWLPSLGFDFHQIKDSDFILFTPSGIETFDQIWLKSLSFNFGLLF